MKPALHITLATIVMLSILSNTLTTRAATIKVEQQEPNDNIAQTVSKIDETG